MVAFFFSKNILDLGKKTFVSVNLILLDMESVTKLWALGNFTLRIILSVVTLLFMSTKIVIFNI